MGGGGRIDPRVLLFFPSRTQIFKFLPNFVNQNLAILITSDVFHKDTSDASDN